MSTTATPQIEPEALKARIERFRQVQSEIVTQVRRVIVGQEEVLEQVMIGLFVGGHCLITGLPGTAKTLGADPHDMAQNIDAGTRLLRDLLLKYDGDVVKALAAYNAGEGAVDKYQGVPPYNETRWYVKKVVDAYRKAGGQ